MLTGDAEVEVEHELIAAGLDLRATVLKMGHHGSRTSTSPEFVAAVNPQIAVYQAGQDNRYGHPHAEPMDTLARADVEVFGTDMNGTIVMTTDGHRLDITMERKPDVRMTAGEISAACIDLNAASSEELTEIIHVGEARAAAIVEGRPWSSVSELTVIGGIGQGRLQDIKMQQLACVR